MDILIITLIIIVIALVISAIPLHLAVTFLGGKSSILKVIFVNLIAGLIIAFVKVQVGIYGGIASFIVLLFIYMFMFKIGFIKAFFVWILQGLIVIGLMLIAALFGISLLI